MRAQLNISVRDSVFDPNIVPSGERKVYVRIGRDGAPLYKVWLYLEGRDLPYVKSVTYYLHSSFPDSVRRIERSPSNPDCELILWTWGLFVISVMIEDKQGVTYTMTHELSYDKELEATPNLRYVREEEPGPHPQSSRGEFS